TFFRYIFDAAGRVVEKIDQDGVSTKTDFDGAGRVTAVIKPYRIYDPDDLDDDSNLPDILVPNPPDRTTNLFRYNLAGNLINQTDANQSGAGTPQKTSF